MADRHCYCRRWYLRHCTWPRCRLRLHSKVNPDRRTWRSCQSCTSCWVLCIFRCRCSFRNKAGLHRRKCHKSPRCRCHRPGRHNRHPRSCRCPIHSTRHCCSRCHHSIAFQARRRSGCYRRRCHPVRHRQFPRHHLGQTFLRLRATNSHRHARHRCRPCSTRHNPGQKQA
jgi:hypothetical protein